MLSIAYLFNLDEGMSMDIAKENARKRLLSQRAERISDRTQAPVGVVSRRLEAAATNQQQ
jgi:hypothetical protein